MEQAAAFWIWLQKTLGFASRRVSYLLKEYGSAESFYRAGPAEWRLSGRFHARELARMEGTSLRVAEEIARRSESLGYWVLTPEDEAYPERLRALDDLPCVLYGRGTLPDLEQEVCISIVGTRGATRYGLDVAFDFGFSLAKAGAVVISGGALGVDSSAHKGALQAGGTTIAVLGCGINTRYLMSQASLRDAVAHNGALISEYPPDTPALPRHFPERNRIISGLSLGTLVVEAGEKSGSLITARLALDQGRDVFAVPGDIRSSVSEGTNRLIKAGCAKPSTCAEDILEEYRWRFPDRLRLDASPEAFPRRNDNLTEITYNETKAPAPRAPEVGLASLSDAARALYDGLTPEAQHIDALAQKTGLTVGRALCALTELELSGLVRTHPGRRYSLSK